MKGLGKLVGGFLGFLFAGFAGFLIGLLIGHIFDHQTAHTGGSHPTFPNSHSSNHYAVNAERIEAAQLLQISINATPVEIKQAYRRCIGKYHPDRLAQQKLPTDTLKILNQKAQQIKQAYEILHNNKHVH